MPGKNSDENSTGFFYMSLAAPNPLPRGGYDQYRFFRRTMMQIYAMDFLQKVQRLDFVVGIASRLHRYPQAWRVGDSRRDGKLGSIFCSNRTSRIRLSPVRSSEICVLIVLFCLGGVSARAGVLTAPAEDLEV